MIHLFLGSIAAGQMVVAPLQNAKATHPHNKHSIAQFCRVLQVKVDLTTNSEEIAEFATKFTTKNQWRLNRHEFRQRGPATRLQYIFQTDHKMTAKLRTVFISCRLRKMRWIMRSPSPQLCPMADLPMYQISV
jgi:hypothetical protein